MTGTPSTHNIPESDGPAPPVRVVASSVSIRRPTACRSMINAATEAESAGPPSIVEKAFSVSVIVLL